MNYNRKGRRNLAKKLGLFGKPETQEEMHERLARAKNAGEQINSQFLAQVESDIREQEVVIEQRQMHNLTESVGRTEAERIIAHNRALEEQRRQKLADREKKRKSK